MPSLKWPGNGGRKASPTPASSDVILESLAEGVLNEQTAAPANKLGTAETAERQAEFKDYIRIFSYAKRQDTILLVAAALSSAAAGVTMPLMIAVFGRLVGNFNDFDAPDGKSQQSFNNTLNQGSLYITGLFIARFVLTYINRVWIS